GDHVVGGAALDSADGNDRRLDGIDLAGHELLQIGDGLAGGDDGVDAGVREGRVAPFADESRLPGVGGGQQRAGLGGDAADFEAGPTVQAENGLGLRADAPVEDAGGDELLGAAAAFFGGLPHEFDADGK